MEWEFRNNQQIHCQLVDAIKYRVVAGRFAPGAQLPPVRKLAIDAGVNPGTVQRALKELQHCGLVCTRSTSGCFITENSALITKEKDSLVQDKIALFLREMDGLGYNRAQVISLLMQKSRCNSAFLYNF